jgi:PAS domain S-box-containing protein
MGPLRHVRSFLFYIPDICCAVLAIVSFFSKNFRSHPMWLPIILSSFFIYALLKNLSHGFFDTFVHRGKTDKLRFIISQFKKGKYTFSYDASLKSDYFSQLIKDVYSIGRNFENILSTQKAEIEKFKELYNNIVLSTSSYFLVLDEKNEIIYANESFCKNFQYVLDEIIGHKVSDVFYFTAGPVEDSIDKARTTQESVVLKSVRLMSKSRVTFIADIKISVVHIQGENQIAFLMDDITSNARKDYQISLISQISESIQKDDEVDMVLHAILTAVTSGSGLGFNRAMLFLCDDLDLNLIGRMAVGPDSFEEALEIWGAAQKVEPNILEEMKPSVPAARKGKIFLNQVLGKKIDLIKNTIFLEALRTQKSIHIVNASADVRINSEFKAFMDVNEFLISPLIAGNRSIGVIIVDNKFNQAPIWHDTIELLSIFSVQAALSIESCFSLSSVKDQMNKIKSRQDAIVESEKLAAVGRIAAHIAHEIRNPLVTVGGYTRRILQQAQGMPKGEKIERAAQVILQETERLEKTLSNVMDFTRPSTYIQEYNNLNAIIEDTVSLLKNVFQERKIECILTLGEDIPLVKSDYNQLKQVILNLYQNAMDSMESGGKLFTKTTLNDTKDKVLIMIRDTGIGIKEENFEHLFDPFFTTKITGVGLGLAVVKKIINDHNGDISAENMPDSGVQFTIELSIPQMDN